LRGGHQDCRPTANRGWLPSRTHCLLQRCCMPPGRARAGTLHLDAVCAREREFAVRLNRRFPRRKRTGKRHCQILQLLEEKKSNLGLRSKPTS
jgi:hypothetical protein